MATLRWRGDAQKIPQVTKVTPANVEPGDTFTLTINRKDISYTAEAATVADVVNGLKAAIDASEIPEWEEVTAGTYTDDEGNVTALKLTGPDDGKPFTLSESTADAGNFSVAVTTVTPGDPGQNEIQRISLGGAPSGGTFTLTFSGQTTAAIAYNASAATVQTALEALSNIAPGDVTVSGAAGGPWTIEFEGTYAATNVPALSGNGASLTGACSVTVVTTTEGQGGVNEVQKVDASAMVSNTLKLYFTNPSGVTSSSPYFAPQLVSASAMTAILEAMASIGAGNVLVKGLDSDGNVLSDVTDTNIWRVTFVGALGNQDVELLLGVSSGAQQPVITEETAGSATGTDEVQVVSLAGGPTGGTFTLTFEGQTTAAIAYNAAAADVKTALEALSNVTTVTVTGNAGGPWTVTFTAPGDQDVDQMTGDASSLTGASVTAVTTQNATAATNEQQQIELTGDPSGGTFTLTWDPGGGAETTAAIAYNASAATVQTALEGLTTPGPGDFSVSGAAGGPWLVEFEGTYAATNVNAMTGDGDSLTGGGSQTLTVTEDTAPSGPNWWSEDENWDTGSAPVTGDAVWFDDPSAADCLYGLDQSAVTLAELHVLADTKLGLPEHTGDYWEYRETKLTIGATLVEIAGDTGRVKLDTGAAQTTLLIRQTGAAADEGVPAVTWVGTHASNVARIYQGSFGAAFFSGEVATLATLDVGYLTNVDSDAEVLLGPGVSWTTINKSGGVLTVQSAGTTLVQTGGSTTLLGSGAITTLRVDEGLLYDRSSGTLTTLDVGSGGQYLREGDLRDKTITTATLHAAAVFRDPFGTLTFSNPLVLHRCSLLEVTLDLGTHITLAPAAGA